MNDDGKTRIIRRDEANPANPSPATRVLPVRQVEQTVKVGAPVAPASEGAPGGLPGVQETRRINIQLPPPASAATPKPGDADGNRTRLFRPGGNKEGGPQETEWDPVAGWIVVVKGPGRGQAVALGIGQNSLGRGADQRARIDFGDDTISRETHAVVTFDPKGGKFYLTHGAQARNLVYLNKTPVLQFTELKTGDEIEIGNTILRFCGFCSEQFKWDEV